ncbi:MAG: flagellar hook-length control protein FliK [Rhodocyclaceae bacterium]|nr:flagellar hook-length control protein FliK [Rhodocyclaceae bacterium]
MAEMVNQTQPHLFQPAPRSADSARSRDAARDSNTADSFSGTLEQRMARSERGDRPAPTAAHSNKTPKATPHKASEPGSSDAARAPETPDSAVNAAPVHPSTVDADTAPESGKTGDLSDGLVTVRDEAALIPIAEDAAASLPPPPAEALAARPAALAAAPANAAAVSIAAPLMAAQDTADTNAEAKAGTDTPGRHPAIALADTAAPSPRAARVKSSADLADTAADTAKPAPDQKGDARDTAVRARGQDFAAQLEARVDRAARPLEFVTPAGTTPPAGNAAAALGSALPLAGAERAVAPQGALPMHVGTPATSAAWADAVGNRVLWLVGRDESRAELILTPPNLGKLEISLTVSGDTTTAQFMAATPAAREALENAMPRLREMLEQAGVTLTDANVNTTAQDQSGAQRDGTGHNAHASRHAATATMPLPGQSGGWVQGGRGMIDTFA